MRCGTPLIPPRWTAKITENIAREVPARANDPLLIGWFIVNEPRYDELPRVIPIARWQARVQTRTGYRFAGEIHHGGGFQHRVAGEGGLV